MMRKLLPFIFLMTCLLASCNLDLMVGSAPELGNDYNPPKEVVFSGQAPSRPMATKSYYEDRIVVSWSAVAGADYYSLERAEFSVTPTQADVARAAWTPIYDYPSALRYEDDDADLRPGYYYAYRVTAHTYVGMQSGETSTMCYGSLLSAPDVIEATKGVDTARITLTWTQMPGVEKYYVYSSDNSDTVAIGDLVATVPQIDSGEPNGYSNSYSYVVPQADLGKNLYFSVAASGGNGSVSNDRSPVTSGYTRVIGAAATPEVDDVTKGDSIDGIVVRWAKDPLETEDDPITYTVTRSYPGSSETVIFPTYPGEELPFDEASQTYYIQDPGDIRENVVYTYSIVAQNNTGMSQANVQTAYLLSPPQELTFTPKEDGSGFDIGVTLPVGADEAETQWEYEVTITRQEGEPETRTFSQSDLENFEFSVTAKSVDDPAYKDEIRCFEVRTVNPGASSASRSGELKSRSSIVTTIDGIPDTPTITASSNRRSLMTANGNGVFPVELTLSVPDESYKPADYVITRTGVEGGIAAQGDGAMEFITSDSTYYDNDGTRVGQVYTYTAVARDALGRESGQSDPVDGYGAITGEAYIDAFEAHLLKPWESPDLHPDYVSGGKSSIWGYISQQGMGSLGSATVGGESLVGNCGAPAGSSGTITYNAVAQGIGGNVSFSYTRYYSEAPTHFDLDFYLSESAGYSMVVSLSGSGTVSGGPFRIGGMYPGVIDFGGLSVSNNAFTGRYSITQTHEGGESAGYEVRL